MMAELLRIKLRASVASAMNIEHYEIHKRDDPINPIN